MEVQQLLYTYRCASVCTHCYTSLHTHRYNLVYTHCYNSVYTSCYNSVYTHCYTQCILIAIIQRILIMQQYSIYLCFEEFVESNHRRDFEKVASAVDDSSSSEVTQLLHCMFAYFAIVTNKVLLTPNFVPKSNPV